MSLSDWDVHVTWEARGTTRGANPAKFTHKPTGTFWDIVQGGFQTPEAFWTFANNQIVSWEKTLAWTPVSGPFDMVANAPPQPASATDAQIKQQVFNEKLEKLSFLKRQAALEPKLVKQAEMDTAISDAKDAKAAFEQATTADAAIIGP